MDHPLRTSEDTRELIPTEPHKHRQGSWYLLTGFLLGLILGLAYSWLINPARAFETAPASLEPEYKDQYRSLIAQVYAATGNFNRAVSRLALLEDKSPIIALGGQAQRILAQDGSELEARSLALLAAAIQNAATSPPASQPIATTEPPNMNSTPNVIPTNTLPEQTATPAQSGEQ